MYCYCTVENGGEGSWKEFSVCSCKLAVVTGILRGKLTSRTCRSSRNDAEPLGKNYDKPDDTVTCAVRLTRLQAARLRITWDNVD
jgi:hypothetical protein